MKPNIYILLLFLTKLVLPAFGQADSKPNILLIMADDMGYADVGVHGCKDFKTPNLDRIANSGIRFTQGYVTNSVCAPSRAGMLSGRIGIGFESNPPQNKDVGLNLELKTMADTMKAAGYATSCIGKWHLGDSPKYYPTQRGFDYFCGLRSGSRSYFYEPKGSDRPGDAKNIEINGKQVKFEGYLTDYFSDKAVEVIKNNKSSKQPFFMFLSYTAPHHSMHAKDEHLAMFSHIKNEKRRYYAAMMTCMDEGIGRVLKCLDDEGISNNTIIVFLSDNGGPTTHNASNNRPLKGGKGSTYEGGMRVPFFIRWAGHLKAKQVCKGPVSSLDLLPTFAAAAGTQAPEKMSGINLLPYLKDSAKTIPERPFFWRRGGMQQCAYRQGDYKWIQNRRSKQTYLYNLNKDVAEKNNLVQQQPEMAEQMEKQYQKWEKSVPDPIFASGWKAKNKK